MKIKDRAKPKQPPVEPGVYPAICIGFVDLGEQYSELFKSYSNKGMFIWELPYETMEIDGKQQPRQLSREFTLSSSKKGNLRAVLESWNSTTYSDDAFAELELFDQVGKPCQLQVVLNDTKEYSRVANLMPLPKGYPELTTQTELIRWDMYKWSDEAFAKLPEWVQEKIKKSSQYQKDHVPQTEVAVKQEIATLAAQTAPIAQGRAPF
jgi:hypothetical protein